MSLYVVTEGDSDQPCKIGSAVDVGKRLCTLNCGNHRQLVLRSQHAIPWLPEEKWLAYQGRVQGIERRIHGRLGHAKLRGEWFYVHFDAAADLIVLELA